VSAKKKLFCANQAGNLVIVVTTTNRPALRADERTFPIFTLHLVIWTQIIDNFVQVAGHSANIE
jgi:hypothetical protein